MTDRRGVIRVRGAPDDVDGFLQDLREQLPDGASVETDRRRGVPEVLAAIAVSVSANAVWEGLKLASTRLAERRNVKILIEEPPAVTDDDR